MKKFPAESVRRQTTKCVGTCAALLTTLAVAGCGSSGGSGTSSSSAPTKASSSAVSSVSAGPADAATTAAVRSAFAVFFNSKSTMAKAQGTLQHGSAFAAALTAQAKNPTAQGITATVSKVVMDSANAASVTFTLLAAGSPILPNTSGVAVKESGTWKVAAQTFCALLGIQGMAPTACSTAAVTSIPS